MDFLVDAGGQGVFSYVEFIVHLKAEPEGG